MKDLKTRNELIEHLISKVREMGFYMDLDNDAIKRYYFGDRMFSFVGYSTKYCLIVTRTSPSVTEDTYTIELIENTPIMEMSTNKIMAISGCTLQRFLITPIILGNTIELDKERINNFLLYIYNIDKVKQSLRKKKLKQINGRLGTKVQGFS